jgi:hypothetical protein
MNDTLLTPLYAACQALPVYTNSRLGDLSASLPLRESRVQQRTCSVLQLFENNMVGDSHDRLLYISELGFGSLSSSHMYKSQPILISKTDPRASSRTG